jgi:hypothetical protein
MPDPAAPITAVEPDPPQPGSRLRLYPLSFLDDGDEVTVGRVDTGSFAVLPRDGAELLRQLAAGMSCDEAVAWYQEAYSETVDMADFVTELDELGFLQHGDDGSVRQPAVRWMRLGKAVFSPVGGLLFTVLLVSCVIVMIRAPALRPTYHHIFFTQYISVVMLVLFFAQVPLILLHEAAHTLAGRRLGLPSRLSIGRRLYFLVFQTTMNSLIGVPRRKRVLPISAGMLADLGVFAVLTLTAALLQQPDGRFSLAARVALGLAFMTLLRLIWQTWCFLETDIYYLVATVLGCVNLHTTTRQLLRNRLSQLLRKPPRYDPQRWHPRDHAVARWYSVFVAAGYAFALVTLLTNMIPAGFHAFSTVLSRLGSGAPGLRGLLDSITFLVLSVGEVLLIIALAVRERLDAART